MHTCMPNTYKCKSLFSWVVVHLAKFRKLFSVDVNRSKLCMLWINYMRFLFHRISVCTQWRWAVCMCNVHKYENVEIVLVDLWLRLKITQATRNTMKTKGTACNERNNKYNRKWSEMRQMYAFQEAWMQFKCDYIKHVVLLAYLQKLYARTPSHQHCVYWMHALDHE